MAAGRSPPSVTPLPIRAPGTTAGARNADELKGWGHRGALAVGSAPPSPPLPSLPAETWVGGARAGDTATKARPLRSDGREPSRGGPLAACRVISPSPLCRRSPRPCLHRGSPQRAAARGREETAGPARSGAGVSRAGPPGSGSSSSSRGARDWLLSWHPPPQIRFPPPGPFADFSISWGLCCCCAV